MSHRRRGIPVGVTVLAICLQAFAGPGRQGVTLTVTPDAVLTDERFAISLDGLTPDQAITLRADGANGQWRASMDVRSDARGRVTVEDPMRLVWSASGERPPAGAGTPADPRWVFTAEVGGRVIATQTLLRRPVAADVRVVPVRERGLVGTVYYPPGPARRPALIVLPGSQGGIPLPSAHAGGLASRGYVVFALAYFNAEGLPSLLANIPLEYFATAVEWLKAQETVDPSRVGVLGTSRGGELALLLGATYPALFRVVVANVPSHVVWPGLSDDSGAPAWTLNGTPVPAVPMHFTAEDTQRSSRERFLARMQDAEAIARAEIPVERINGPLLLFSGQDDQLWPSDLFCARIVERLKARRFTHPVEHHTFASAGHQIGRPFVPTSDVRQTRIHPVSKRAIMFGGTPEGQARANEESWGRLLTFLARYLKS